MNHPYKNLPDRQFWSRAVAGYRHLLSTRFMSRRFAVSKTSRIATAGSCFAQPSRELLNSGFNYFVTETGPSSSSVAEREARNFGQFSARYGNVYTVRQLLQLFERAFGNPNFAVEPWQLTRAGWIRFAGGRAGWLRSLDALATDTHSHLESFGECF